MTVGQLKEKLKLVDDDADILVIAVKDDMNPYVVLFENPSEYHCYPDTVLIGATGANLEELDFSLLKR